jgi:hypothetical protein
VRQENPSPRKDRGKFGIAENVRQTLAIIERARQ